MSDWTVTPDPPVCGQPVTICFNGAVPTTIEITFNPGNTTSHPITEENRCVTVDIPAEAITCGAHDTSGGTVDYSSPCKDS